MSVRYEWLEESEATEMTQKYDGGPVCPHCGKLLSAPPSPEVPYVPQYPPPTYPGPWWGVWPPSPVYPLGWGHWPETATTGAGHVG